MEGMEAKIHMIEQDLNKNKELIADIKNWVGLLAKGDDNALGHLVKLVNEKSGDVIAVPKKDDLVKDQAQKPVAVPEARKQDSAAGEAAKPGEIYEVSPGEKVAVSGSMCSLSSSKGANADIDMHQVVDTLPFDNPDGGAWKQGWDVKYDPSEVNTKKLKIFVVPHSHCDPEMILPEEVPLLDQYDPKDFEEKAHCLTPSPFFEKVYRHKNEAWSFNETQLINQLKKAGLDTQVKHIVEVLDEWRGSNHGKVWVSDTLPADLNLPFTDEDHPAENTLQAFFIGENLPSFVLTLFNLQNDDCGPDLEEHIHDYTVATLQELNESLLDFCHDRFTILPCTLDMQNFNVESLERELELREEECEEFYDGPIDLDRKVSNTVTQAAVLLQGISRVPCDITSTLLANDKDGEFFILLDREWRSVVHLLIECFTHAEFNPSSIQIPPKSTMKMQVALLEAARRLERSNMVTSKSFNNEINRCVEQLSNQLNCTLQVEVDKKSGRSFTISLQFSVLLKEDTAAVASSTSQNLTPVKEARTRDFINSALTDDEPGSLCPGQGTTSMETRNEMITLSMSQADEIGWARSIKISGIPEDGKKNTKGKIEEVSANCQNDVLEFLNDKLGLDLQTCDIKKVCRLGENRPRRKKSKGHGPRPILILFASEGKRDAVFKRRSMLDGSGFRIEEYLPYDKLCLLRKAQRNPNCKDAWSEDEKIYMVTEIRSSSDLPDMITKVQTGDVTHKYDKKGEQLDDQEDQVDKKSRKQVYYCQQKQSTSHRADTRVKEKHGPRTVQSSRAPAFASSAHPHQKPGRQGVGSAAGS